MFLRKRIGASSCCILPQFYDLRCVDFVLFSATYRFVFGDIISFNGVNRLNSTQGKGIVVNRNSTYSNYKNNRFEKTCLRTNHVILTFGISIWCSF